MELGKPTNRALPEVDGHQSWEKPNLRARLDAEKAAAAPKKTGDMYPWRGVSPEDVGMQKRDLPQPKLCSATHETKGLRYYQCRGFWNEAERCWVESNGQKHELPEAAASEQRPMSGRIAIGEAIHKFNQLLQKYPVGVQPKVAQSYWMSLYDY